MAELGTAAIGAGVALGATVYTAATGFVARHESVHSLQVTEIRRHITDFESAYGRGEVTEEDWQIYLAIRTEARKKESEYEESISAYKETPVFRFVTKWNQRREVRRKKKALQRANRSLRLHYYESTSDASDTSSVTAESGSPPRSRRVHSDEDDRRILSWAEDVAGSDAESHGLAAYPSRKESTRKRRIAAEQRRRDELRDAYTNLKDTLPAVGPQGRLTLLDRAAKHILDLEDRNKKLRECIAREEAELERLRLLNRSFSPSDDSSSHEGLELPFCPYRIGSSQT